MVRRKKNKNESVQRKVKSHALDVQNPTTNFEVTTVLRLEKEEFA
jgi:hypothetical protein